MLISSIFYQEYKERFTVRSVFFVIMVFLLPVTCFAENLFLKRFPLAHEKVEKGESLLYSLHSADLPKNEEMLLLTRRLNGQPLVEIKELFTNETGDIVTTMGGNIPFMMPVNDVAMGEPVEFIVVPKKQYLNRNKRKPVAAIGSIVARPIEVEDANGHSLSIYVASPDGMHFLVAANGFHPREKLDAVVITDRGEIKLSVRATKEGTFGASIAPAPIGMKEGTFAFELRGATTNGLLVDHVWGKGAFNPLTSHQ